MIHEDAKTLVKQSEKLFTDKLVLDSKHQGIADNFYPERGNFTNSLKIDDEFASHLYSSYPLIKFRDLADQIGAMLRPRQTEWFEMGMLDDRHEDQAAKGFYQDLSRIMRRAMYESSAHFQRASKECDRDYTAFGQHVFSCVLNRNRNGLLYRNHHLRDTAWTENAWGEIDRKFVKWTLTKSQMIQYFGEKVHEKIKRCKEDDKEFKVLHVVLRSEDYRNNTPLKNYSLWIDQDNEHIMEEIPYATEFYRVSRWATISTSQYAYSPAVVAGLPDARLIQDMTRVLLEAGEKAVDPPLIATENVIRSDVSLYAGGITYVSDSYDERLGEALRALNIDKSGLAFGQNTLDLVQLQLAQALYLDKFQLPATNEMTATEVDVRYDEYRRTILPIFEPMEEESSAAFVQETFDVMFRAGAFGVMDEIPVSVRRNPDYEFKFQSPISQSSERKKISQFMSVQQILGAAASIDPVAIMNVNVNRATRDAIDATGADADWLVEEGEALVAQKNYRQQQEAQKGMDIAQQGVEMAGALNSAG